VLTAALLTAAVSSAQSTRLEKIDEEKSAKAASVRPEARETGDVILTRLERVVSPEPPALKLTFGGFRPGAGFAPGVAWVMPVAGHALSTTRAVWSFKNFKLLESALDLPTLGTGRIDVRTFARWEDAPTLSFFGRGADTTPSDELDYGLRSSEAGANARIRLTRRLSAGGGLEYLDVRSTEGAVTRDLPSTTAWVHTSVNAAFDTRASAGYTDRGTLWQITLHDYADRDGRSSFTRADIDLRQFIPLVHDNWIVALQGRANLTGAADDQAIPFFMLPYIGGGDTVRGFDEYRFTDRDSVLLRGELRWTPASVLDMAIFTDGGTVAPAVRSLGLKDFKRGWGIGARIHGSTFTALRLDVAHSDEGWRFHVANHVSF
jgi:hypothetical protein